MHLVNKRGSEVKAPHVGVLAESSNAAWPHRGLTRGGAAGPGPQEAAPEMLWDGAVVQVEVEDGVCLG